MSNCEFVLENSETSEWVFPYKFDYIHLRNMGPCFSAFATVIRKSYENLSSGGWIEFNDGNWVGFGDDDSFDGSAIQRFFTLVREGGALHGRDMTKSRSVRSYLIAAGFVDIREHTIPVPLSGFSTDARWRRVGQYVSATFGEYVTTYRKFLVAAGLTSTEIDGLAAEVRRELSTREVRAFMSA